jgi:class 3 adenylate cyclase
MTAEKPRVIAPYHRPPARLSRGLMVAVALAALFLWIQNLMVGEGGSETFGILGLAVAFLSGTMAAAWAEKRVYQMASARGWLARWALTVALPLPLSIFVLILLSVLEPLAEAMRLGGLAALFVIGFSLWYLGAAGGSVIIRVIDEVISALVPGFRSRIIAAVSVLLVFLVGGTGIISLLTVSGDLAMNLPDANVDLSDAPIFIRWMVELGNGPPADKLTLVFMVGILVSLPALVSALSKMGDAILERVVPLTIAFDALAAGHRNVRLEVGGSREFRDLATQFNQMVTNLSLSEKMERAFGVYVSSQVLDQIKKQHGQVLIPAQLRTATVFFADIRGFTDMSEKLPPQEVVSILNRYFERVVQIVDTHQGYLDKFIGDAVVVVMNGPIDQADHAQRAANCATAVQKAVSAMNAEGLFPEIGALEVGIGIATGPMVAGNIGGESQMEYTVIGDTVNLAARLCGKAPGGAVWVNQACRDGLKDHGGIDELEAMAVKGKAEKVRVHQIWPIGDTPGEDLG